MDINLKNDKIFEALLSSALIESSERELAELKALPDEHTLSPGFDKKISKLASGVFARKRAKTAFIGALRAAACLACVLGIAFSLLLTQPKVSAAVNNVIRRPISGDTDEISFNPDCPAPEFNPNVRPAYLPEGYYISEIRYEWDSTAAYLTYQTRDGEKLSFDYYLAGDAYLYIDSKAHLFEAIPEGGQTYYLYSAIDPADTSSLIWCKDGYACTIEARAGRDELIKIAESVSFSDTSGK